MGLEPLDFFVEARFPPIPAVALLLVGAWYALTVVRVGRMGRPWPRGRTAAFATGWALLAVTAFSGLWAFAGTNFSAFGALYITAGLAAPAGLALGAPLTLAARASTRPVPRPWTTRRWAPVANPFTTWILFSASVFVLFFTPGLLRDATSGGLVEQVVWLWWVMAGTAFLWPVADADPAPYRMGTWTRILYLLLTFPVFAIMGMGLESQSGRPAPGVSPASLHLGAAVIWVAAEGLALCGALAVFAQWLRADERRARSHDQANEAAAARQLALWRASREAAARAASP